MKKIVSLLCSYTLCASILMGAAFSDSFFIALLENPLQAFQIALNDSNIEELESAFNALEEAQKQEVLSINDLPDGRSSYFHQALEKGNSAIIQWFSKQQHCQGSHVEHKKDNIFKKGLFKLQSELSKLH